YVDGETLDAHCNRRQATVRDAVGLLLEVARAVAYAHRQGVLHRDLKPSNVLVDGDGVPKVTDFGLARSLHQDEPLTEQGELFGTPGYMSPEQVAGGAGLDDPAIDCYGLGAILYALLTGRPPFRAETPVQTCLQVSTEEPVPPSRLLRGLPKD